MKKLLFITLLALMGSTVYAQDYNLTKKVCEFAQKMLDRKDETHFRSRTLEHGRSAFGQVGVVLEQGFGHRGFRLIG